LTAIDLNACGIDDHVLDAVGKQVAVQPKAIPAGFVATNDTRVRRQPKALLRLGDFLVQRRQFAGLDRPQPGLLAVAGGEGQFPFIPAQLKGQVQNDGRCGPIACVGR